MFNARDFVDGRVIRQLRVSASRVRWYLRELMGDSRYERHLAHLRSHDPAAVIPTEAQYWREKHRADAANPQSRCC